MTVRYLKNESLQYARRKYQNHIAHQHGCRTLHTLDAAREVVTRSALIITYHNIIVWVMMYYTKYPATTIQTAGVPISIDYEYNVYKI